MKIFVIVAATLAGATLLAPAQTGARITLAGGESIIGELRGGYEAVRRGVFTRVDERAPGAGLRVYSPQGATGYTFIARERIVDVTRGVALEAGTTDRNATRDAWLAWRAKEREAIETLRALRHAAIEARALAEIPPPPPTWLERFPPSEGWKPDLVDHLRWRALVLHLYPTPEQREWLANFDAWYVEYVAWLARQVPPPIPFLA